MSRSDPGRLAVVDVGSNSVRLLLCTGVGPEGPEGERVSTVTALRRGAGPDGRVAPDALERLDACLAGYAARVRDFAPRRVLPVGTNAVRDAPNRAAIGVVVRARLGVPLRVVSGEREAALSFRGARLAVGGDEPVLVVDIGGGSTELVRGGSDGPQDAVSLALGCVRSTERHLRHDPPRPDELAALHAEAVALVAPALAAAAGLPVVGVAGTLTTLAAVELGGYDPRRVHRFRLGRADVARITSRLAALPLAERRTVPGLHPDRAPVIVAGGVIASAVLESAGADALLISERDLLDGIALSADEIEGAETA